MPEPDTKPKGPPLRVDATLHLAWALTLFISSDENQRNLADKLKDNMLASFKTDGLDDIGKKYVNNLTSVVSAYLRRIGFEKDAYDAYLDSEKNKLARITDYWKNLGDMTNFSSESTIIKVTSFMGVGTTASFFKDWLESFKAAKSEALQNLGNVTQHNVTSVGSDMNNLQVFSPESIGYVLIFGAIGLFGTIVFLKWFGNTRVEKAISETSSRQQEYWERVMRPQYQKALRHLYGDIKDLVNSYYPGYDDEPVMKSSVPLTSLNESLDKVINEILPTQVVYRLPKSRQ